MMASLGTSVRVGVVGVGNHDLAVLAPGLFDGRQDGDDVTGPGWWNGKWSTGGDAVHHPVEFDHERVRPLDRPVLVLAVAGHLEPVAVRVEFDHAVREHDLDATLVLA